MFNIKVIVDLPFFIQLEKPLTVSYENVCKESLLPELKGKKVKIAFSQRFASDIDKSEWSKVRSNITIKVSTPVSLSEMSIFTFTVHNCREIINNIISSYQATTLQTDNVGFIIQLGTSYMQLFAEILVNGKNIRDRYPSYSANTSPLTEAQLREFKRYLRDKDNLPLSRLFLTNASLLLEQGQYSLAVLQSAMAVELRLTQVIRKKLIKRRWPNEAIVPYEQLTLGNKLGIHKADPRSLEFHFSKISGFSEMFKKLDSKINQPRNRVLHKGYMASLNEAVQAVVLAKEFFKIVD
jgi:hypothetical protein